MDKPEIKLRLELNKNIVPKVVDGLINNNCQMDINMCMAKNNDNVYIYITQYVQHDDFLDYLIRESCMLNVEVIEETKEIRVSFDGTELDNFQSDYIAFGE